MPRSPGCRVWRMRNWRSAVAAVMPGSRARALGPFLEKRELQEYRALQDVIEVVVRDHRQHRLALGAAMHRQPLHVVDLEARIGLDQRLPGQARARRDLVV